MRLSVVVVGLVLAGFAGAVLLRSADLGQWPWLVSRASGVVAFGLLTGSMVLGLLVSTKAGDGILPRPAVFDLHQFMSVLVLTFTGVHVASLLFDGFLAFTPIDLLVPFRGPYEPAWTGLGVLAGWAAAIVTASFWARKRIGQKNWRRLHYVSFLAYVMAFGHGVMAGTDSGRPVVVWVYLLSAAMVSALMTYRIGGVLLKPAEAKRRVRREAPEGAASVPARRAA